MHPCSTLTDWVDVGIPCPAKSLKSEMIDATTKLPAGIRLPDAGSSKKAFADFILRSRLLIWWPVLSATNLEVISKENMVMFMSSSSVINAEQTRTIIEMA